MMMELSDIPLPDNEVPTVPQAWIMYIESYFWLRHISDDQDKFNHLSSSLQEDIVGQILDLVEPPP
jgi:hypothetical protein